MIPVEGLTFKGSEGVFARGTSKSSHFSRRRNHDSVWERGTASGPAPVSLL